ATDVAQAGLGHREQVLALVDNFALEPRVAVAGEAEDGHRRDALAGARLADNPEDLSAVELEVDAVHGAHEPILGCEPNVEALHFQQSLRHLSRPDPWVEKRVQEIDERA